LNCSDATAAEIDTEVVNLLKESYEKALELLRENREIMDKIAEFLIEKETITGKEFMEIFRREKGLPEPEEKDKNAEGEDANAEEVAESTTTENDADSKEAADETPEDSTDAASTEESGSAVDITVTDDTPTAKEQEEENVGRFSNGRL
jgi:cell division protease FtsH